MSEGSALWIAVRRLPMVTSVTIRLTALIAAPAYMSRTAFSTGGGGAWAEPALAQLRRWDKADTT